MRNIASGTIGQASNRHDMVWWSLVFNQWPVPRSLVYRKRSMLSPNANQWEPKGIKWKIRTAELSGYSRAAVITCIFNFYIENTNARLKKRSFSLENRQQWFSQFRVIVNINFMSQPKTTRYLVSHALNSYRANISIWRYSRSHNLFSWRRKSKGIGSKLYSLSSLHQSLISVFIASFPVRHYLQWGASIALHATFWLRSWRVQWICKENGNNISSMWLEKALDADIPLKSFF